MPKRIYKQTSFNAGEISPLMYSREELEKYNNSLKTATNCFATPYGPIQRRNGFKYIAGVKSHSATVRLIPFRLTTSTTYLLVS